MSLTLDVTTFVGGFGWPAPVVYEETRRSARPPCAVTLATDTPDTVDIFGEVFTIAQDGDDVYLIHPRWSLIGAGRSVADACDNVIVEAQELADAMRSGDPGTLSTGAQQLRDFVLRLA